MIKPQQFINFFNQYIPDMFASAFMNQYSFELDDRTVYTQTLKQEIIDFIKLSLARLSNGNIDYNNDAISSFAGARPIAKLRLMENSLRCVSWRLNNYPTNSYGQNDFVSFCHYDDGTTTIWFVKDDKQIQIMYNPIDHGKNRVW